MAAVKPSGSKRLASAQARRNQLIMATIKCIAQKGLSGVTMADITTEAGLSLGIVNLHFQSKEKLLIETLRYISDEYRSGLDKIFDDPKKTTAEKITAHIRYDFSRKIVDRNKLAVWFALWCLGLPISKLGDEESSTSLALSMLRISSTCTSGITG